MTSATMTVTVLRREACDPELDWVRTMLLDARACGWYGELTLTYRAGRIVLARRNETIQPPG